MMAGGWIAFFSPSRPNRFAIAFERILKMSFRAGAGRMSARSISRTDWQAFTHFQLKTGFDFRRGPGPISAGFSAKTSRSFAHFLAKLGRGVYAGLILPTRRIPKP